ncbi:hypothetical protein BD779DRAFT_1224869 [Infundibulicybe gibba]|nr:hypothetical protein BD779DRAFT_1224869 [Infundibulicybe gibba]
MVLTKTPHITTANGSDVSWPARRIGRANCATMSAISPRATMPIPTSAADCLVESWAGYAASPGRFSMTRRVPNQPRPSGALGQTSIQAPQRLWLGSSKEYTRPLQITCCEPLTENRERMGRAIPMDAKKWVTGRIGVQATES